MNKELTLQEAALAWAQGKRVEARPSFRDGGPWDTISRVGHMDSSRWPASILNEDVAYKFRLAPEPPAKKFQPFTKGTIPKFALWKYPLNRDEAEDFYCITGYGDVCVLLDDDWISYQDLLTNGRMSTDNGKTWLPCGVEVES